MWGQKGLVDIPEGLWRTADDWQLHLARVAAWSTGAPRNLWDATRASGDNFLVVKVSYWLGVN